VTPTSTTPPTFAPSELVLLFGDRFVPEAGMLPGKEEILTSGVKVYQQKLMEYAMQAAVWAVHRSGAATLEVREGKALFGLMKTRTLHLARGTGPWSFPENSMEWLLADRAGLEPKLEDALAQFIGAEVRDPSERAVNQIKAGMGLRSLLEVVEKKTMMVFTTVAYKLPASTRALAEAEPIDDIRRMVEEAQAKEPELYRQVDAAIDAARVQMTEHGD
jgi:hypothetical protein